MDGKTSRELGGAAAGVAGTQATPGVVVLYAHELDGLSHRHERATRMELGRRIAALKGFDFAGEFAPSTRYPDTVYYLPSTTITSVEKAAELGIFDEHDLFGGVVPYAFVATKAITHPLVETGAYAPEGWSHDFDRRVHDAVPHGFTAFTIADARRAGARLLERSEVRIKPVLATGGHGQSVVSDTRELEAALAAIDASHLEECGVVLEENLSDVTTYSVGRVCVADLVATYCGTQRLTRDNSGEHVYGGSDLLVARGDFDALLALDLSGEARLAVDQARRYDSAATEFFPGFFASRRNYDVAHGTDCDGRRRSGVLEQSWRMGGASGAEVAALEAFRSEPSLRCVRASCAEIYGDGQEPPRNAVITFRGDDEDVGLITKYTLVEPHDYPK